MFLHRLAGGLAFLAGVGLSRLGIQLELWPLMAAGLITLTLGLWHFLVAGSALQVVRGEHRPAGLEEPPNERPADLPTR